MKTINPQTLLDYRAKNQPAILAISNKGIHFTNITAKLLAIEVGSKFELAIDGDKLYYKESGSGFEVNTALAKGSYLATEQSIQKHISHELYGKEAAESMRFEIGIMKDGMRLLTPVNK